jgi:hypothetical protein
MYRAGAGGATSRLRLRRGIAPRARERLHFPRAAKRCSNRGPRAGWRHVICAGLLGRALRPLAHCLRAAALVGMVLGCAETASVPPSKPLQERPEEAIISVSRKWEARYSERGLRPSDSPIASYDRQFFSRIELVRQAVSISETLRFTELYVMRSGGQVHCAGQLEFDNAVTFGRKDGEAALELSWPDLEIPRLCDSEEVSEKFVRSAGKAVFALRSDQLVPIAPATERRTFLPGE